jgi:hypothetical protein
VIEVANLTALRITSLVKARHDYGRGELPEPIAMSVDRRGSLTLVFEDREAMIAWRDQLYEYEQIPSDRTYPAEEYRGIMRAEDRGATFEIPTTVRFRPTI